MILNVSGEIPSVHGIQSWIERAWSDGFDPEGASELAPLLGTNTWIGASECAALLRYFNIRASVVDFGLELGKYSERCDHRRRLKQRPFDAVCDLCREPIINLGGKSYFCGYCDYDECCKCREKLSNDNAPSSEDDLNDDINVVRTAPKRKFDKFSKSAAIVESRVSKQLHQWLTGYFSSQWDHSSSEDFRPPIYFQHDGHSRTIVG
jgi:zinc finger-containing ubiquitin peptidase 1